MGDFIRKIDFLKAKDSGDYEDSDDNPSNQLTNMERQYEDMSFDDFKVNMSTGLDKQKFQRKIKNISLPIIFTCVALAKAGLVVGPLCPSVRPSVRLSVRSYVRPSVRPSVRNTFGVPSLCNL